MVYAAKIAIDSGFEIRTDMNGDRANEMVYVHNNKSGDRAFTQLSAEINSDTVFTDFEGYWSSYIISGDLSGNIVKTFL